VTSTFGVGFGGVARRQVMMLLLPFRDPIITAMTWALLHVSNIVVVDLYVRPRLLLLLLFVLSYIRTRDTIIPIAWPISLALMSALPACVAFRSLARTARLPAPTRVARRAYAPSLRIGSSIVCYEAYGLQLRRRGIALLLGGMGGVVLVMGTASHGWSS
jgi:hypothetical protein